MGDRVRAKCAEKWGLGCCAFSVGELGPHLTQCRLSRGLPPYQVVSWPIQPFGHNRHGSKSGGFCTPLEGAESASNTMWPGPRPTSVPSGTLIHLAVWPQYMGRKLVGRAVLLLGWVSWVPIYRNVAWSEAYLHAKFHLAHASKCRATIDMGHFWKGGVAEGVLCPLFWGCAVPL